jgi:hypothetical protein
MTSLAVVSRWAAYRLSAACSAAVSNNCSLRVRFKRAALGGRPNLALREAIALLCA